MISDYSERHSYLFWFGIGLFAVAGFLSAVDGVVNGFMGYLQCLTLWIFFLAMIATFVGVLQVIKNHS